MEQEPGAIILAGGKNSRMGGRDKAFLEVEGRPIILRIIDTLKPLVKEIIIVTNVLQRYGNFKVKLVRDESPGMGPLLALYSGLKASSAEYNFVVACDMPFLKMPLVKYMLAQKDNYDAVVPKIAEELHPLCALYSKACLPAIEEALRQDSLQVRSIFSKMHIRYLLKEELEEFDKNLVSLVNINTKEEFSKVLNSCASL